MTVPWKDFHPLPCLHSSVLCSTVQNMHCHLWQLWHCTLITIAHSTVLQLISSQYSKGTTVHSISTPRYYYFIIQANAPLDPPRCQYCIRYEALPLSFSKSHWIAWVLSPSLFQIWTRIALLQVLGRYFVGLSIKYESDVLIWGHHCPKFTDSALVQCHLGSRILR